VLVVALTHEIERSVRTQSRDDVLAALERNTDYFGVKCRRFADACVSVGYIFSALRESAFDELIADGDDSRRRAAGE
jgi:hypothetical protein